MPTEDIYGGTGYFKDTDVVIGASKEKFWTEDRINVDFQFILIGLVAVALLGYYGVKR